MKKIGVLLLVWCALLSAPARAVLDIEVSEGQEGALPIAIVPFGWAGEGEAPADIAAIVRADLVRSGRFAPIPVEKLVAQPRQAAEVNYKAWRNKGSDTLVVGRILPQEDGVGYIIQFQLLDVLRGQQLLGYNIPASLKQLRMVGHQISNLVYEKLIGDKGAFDTHIAYITAEETAEGKRYQLAVADADGNNERILLVSTQPLMSVSWSRDGKRLAYVSFENGRPAVFIQHIASGQRIKLAAYSGINGAPAWSPDGKRVALTLSKDGNAEIYLVDLDTNLLTRVTRHFAIDTEPTWWPDGKSLLFTSDRGGKPQIYRVDLGDALPTDKAERLTFEGEYNARPALSPDGRFLAMIHGTEGGRYRIAVQDLTNGNVRLLTENNLDESPSFSPNGLMLLYATLVKGRGVLEAVSMDGRNHHRLGTLDGDVREPAWSPFVSNN